MKKHIFFLLITCLFISCKMDVKNKVCISGSINLDENINLQKRSSARSAFPTFPETVHYKIEAVKDGETTPVLGEVYDDLSFSITVEAGFTGTITVNGYYDYAGYTCHFLKGETQITAETSNIDNLTITVSFMNDAETGYLGAINLPIYVDAEEITIFVSLNDEKNEPQDFSFDVETPAITYFTSNGAITPGSYIANIIIKNSAGNILFACTESINVSSNMTTSTWVNSAGSGQSIDYFREMKIDEKQQTVLYISNELIDKYKYSNNIFYVKENTNAVKDGSFLYPFSTPQDAMDKIKVLNSALETPGSITYTIIIDGEIVNNSTNTSMLSINPEGEKEVNVRIMGINSDTKEIDIEGTKYNIPECTLNANNLSRVISVGEKATVTIGPNLTITGGEFVYGSGISVQGKLTLDGAVIYDNIANGYETDGVGGLGAGILIAKGSCVIKSGMIINNKANKLEGYESYGGGICCRGEGCELEISGQTEIAYNKADNGGGIYSGGKISIGTENNLNKIININNNNSINGGGIFIEDIGTVYENKIYQVQFANNKATYAAGGICNKGTNLTVGNSEFLDCQVISDKDGYGGGIYGINIEGKDSVDITIKDCSFENCYVKNKETDVQSISDPNTYLACGGGCYVNGSSLYVENTTFNNCSAQSYCNSYGGGLFLCNNSSELTDISITECEANIIETGVLNTSTLGNAINQLSADITLKNTASKSTTIDNDIYIQESVQNLTLSNFTTESKIKLTLPDVAYLTDDPGIKILNTNDDGKMTDYKDMFELNKSDYCINSEGKIEKKKTIYNTWDSLCDAVADSSVVEGQVFYISGNLEATKSLVAQTSIKINGVGSCSITRKFTDGPIFTGYITEIKGESDTAKITIDGFGIEGLEQYYDSSTKCVSYDNLIANNEIDGYVSNKSCLILSNGTNSIGTVTIQYIIFKNYAAADCTFIFQEKTGGSNVETLNITNCEFENNIIYSNILTGAVLGINAIGYNCNITSCTLKNNKAISNNSGTSHGGAVAITAGNVMVNSVTAQANKSYNVNDEEVNDDIYIKGNNSKLKFYNINIIDCLYLQGDSMTFPELTAVNSIANQSKQSKITFYIDKDDKNEQKLLTINSINSQSSYYEKAFVVKGKNNPFLKFDYNVSPMVDIYINY